MQTLGLSEQEIAVYLGFKWRDETPSGALSIQWYNEYIKTKDEKILYTKKKLRMTLRKKRTECERKVVLYFFHKIY